MLFVAAALLIGSMHSLGVIEPLMLPVAEAVSATSVVQEHGALHTGLGVGSGLAVTRIEVPAGREQPSADAGRAQPSDDADRVRPSAGGDPALTDLVERRDAAFLAALAAMTPEQLRAADRDDAVLAVAEDDPPGVEDVRRWWAALSESRRAELLAAAPSVVGNLEGVPYVVRDAANRQTLRDAMDGDGDGDGARVSAAMVDQVREALVVPPGDAHRWLVTFDTRGTGRAAIAVGDLDAAAHVTVLVPGMFFTVSGQMADFTATANDLYAEQATLAPVTPAAGGSGVAVLAWMGYRTPDLSNILSLDLARTGAERLERTMTGLDALRAGDEPRVSVVAHSYGSTTALMALASGRVHADSLTVLGSPGSTVRSAAALDVPAGQVFVGGAHGDPVAGSGYFGTDPGSSAFGSTVLDLGVGAEADGVALRRPVGHNDYLKPGTASLHDVALVAIGRGDLVRHAGRGSGDGPGDGLRSTPDFLLVRPQDLQPRE